MEHQQSARTKRTLKKTTFISLSKDVAFKKILGQARIFSSFFKYGFAITASRERLALLTARAIAQTR